MPIHRHWSPAVFSSGAIMLCGVFICAICVVAATWIALQQPWLGLDVRANIERGLVEIVDVSPDGPSPAMTLPAQLVAISLPDDASKRVALVDSDVVEEPDFFDTYEELADFYQRQSKIHALLTSAAVELELIEAHDKSVTLKVAAGVQPLSDLPVVYWVQLLVGVGGMLIGTWIWSLRQSDWGAAMFALAGLCMLIFTFPAAIYSTREIALEGTLFRQLSALNHLGAMGFGAAMIALFLSYPRQIVRPRWLLLLALIMIPWWMADTLRLLSGPHVSHQLFIMSEMLLIAAAVLLQWWLNRNDIRNRAALRWLGLSVVIGAGAFVTIIIMPTVIGTAPTISQGYSFLFFLLIYIGIAFGLRRYRLFELDKWAFRILFYTGAVVALLALDVGLIYFLSLERDYSFGISLLVVGFCYLPLRTLLWKRAILREHMREDKLFRAVIEVAFEASSTERAAKWRALVKWLFEPLEIRKADRDVSDVELGQDGLELTLPGTAGMQALLVRHPWNGKSLFGPRDLQLARQLISLMHHAEQSRDAFERGAAGERKRIAQDLHDDVGARLLSGLHKKDIAQTHETLRESLADIRSIVSGLTGEQLPLAQVLGDFRHETAQRFDVAGIELDWPMDASDATQTWLEYRIYKNLRSALREIVSNILHHSHATRVNVATDVTNGSLRIDIDDNGVGLNGSASTPRRGNGLKNIDSRIAELGGSCSFLDVEQGTAISLTLPLQIKPAERQ